ncbi:DUF4232 domain-containing protein [Streptomyces sp. M19]
MLAKDGQSIGQPATRAGEAGSAVTLPPGGSGHAVLHTVNEESRTSRAGRTPRWCGPTRPARRTT